MAAGQGCVFGEGMAGMRATRYRSQPDTANGALAARQPAKLFRSPPNAAFTPLLQDTSGLWRSQQRPATAHVDPSAPPLRVKSAFSGLSV